MSLFTENPEYQAFEDKFKPKKTTDDCYTPPEIYSAVLEWVCNRYGVDPTRTVRPFFPGGDYVHYPYQDRDVVIDNPPFSILSKIVRFYVDTARPFFLFAPSLTCLGIANGEISHIIPDANITYENGAIVRTAFVTNLEPEPVILSAPDLHLLLKERSRCLKTSTTHPKYVYPENVLTAPEVQKLSRYGQNLQVRWRDCLPVRALDTQRAVGKAIFGAGVLLDSESAAEKAAAEKAAAIRWELSDRELGIIAQLDKMRELREQEVQK